MFRIGNLEERRRVRDMDVVWEFTVVKWILMGYDMVWCLIRNECKPFLKPKL